MAVLEDRIGKAAAIKGTYPASAATAVPEAVKPGEFYWVGRADGLALDLYTNNNGAAQKVDPEVSIPTGAAFEEAESEVASLVTVAELAADRAREASGLLYRFTQIKIGQADATSSTGWQATDGLIVQRFTPSANATLKQFRLRAVGAGTLTLSAFARTGAEDAQGTFTKLRNIGNPVNLTSGGEHVLSPAEFGAVAITNGEYLGWYYSGRFQITGDNDTSGWVIFGPDGGQSHWNYGGTRIQAGQIWEENAPGFDINEWNEVRNQVLGGSDVGGIWSGARVAGLGDSNATFQGHRLFRNIAGRLNATLVQTTTVPGRQLNQLLEASPSDYPPFVGSAAALSAADFANVDLCLINCATNSFGFGRPLGAPGDPFSANTFWGDLQGILIDRLQTWKPTMRIAVATPTRRYEGGNTGNSPNGAGVTVKQYADAVMQFCRDNGLIGLDLWGEGSGINGANWQLMMSDGLHFTAAGYDRLEHYIAARVEAVAR